jgi:aminopeptidase N
MRALRRHTNAADRERLMFATGAAAHDAKRRYLDAFLDDRSTAEAWIEEALAPFNAVEHAPQTRPLLARALRALPRLKHERKIFFVNRWVAAFIGGQCSAQALQIVRRELPRLPPDLRRKVLEASDDLARTVRIRARFGGEAAVPEAR